MKLCHVSLQVQKKKGNFKQCLEIKEENTVIQQNLSHGGALVHMDVSLNYLNQGKDKHSKKITCRNQNTKSFVKNISETRKFL